MPRDLPADQTANIRRWLQQVAEHHGLGNKDLQQVTGVSETTLRNLLHDDDHPNQTKNMRRTTVQDIARGFRINPGDLLAYAKGSRDVPIPDEVPWSEAEPLNGRLDRIEQQVERLTQTVERLERLLPPR